MNKELAKTITTALVQFIDSERPEGTMCCSNTECESIEKMFEGECFDIIETFIQKKLSRLTEFEKAVEAIYESCGVKELQVKKKAYELLALAREQFIKDGYVVEKKAFNDAVEKVSPETMKEVSDNVDKMKEGLTELEQCLFDYGNERDMYKYDPTNVAELNEKVIELTKFYANVLLTIAKKELLKDLPRWRVELGDMEYVAYGIIGGGVASKENPRVYLDGHSIDLYSLEKLPGFNEG